MLFGLEEKPVTLVDFPIALRINKMEQESYNPSTLEVHFANALEQLKEEIAELLPQKKIVDIHKLTKLDNPQLNIKLESPEGKAFEVVIRIIQRADV